MSVHRLGLGSALSDKCQLNGCMQMADYPECGRTVVLVCAMFVLFHVSSLFADRIGL